MTPQARARILTAGALLLAGIIIVLILNLPDSSGPFVPAQPKPLPEGQTSLPTVPIETTPPPLETATPSQGAPSFRLLVSPVEARARPGEAILYTMTIEPEGGFNATVSLDLDVRALFLYHQSFDLGTIDPPYPKTVSYRFVVPPDVPAGITVSGVLAAEGGGVRNTASLILLISG